MRKLIPVVPVIALLATVCALLAGVGGVFADTTIPNAPTISQSSNGEQNSGLVAEGWRETGRNIPSGYVPQYLDGN